MTQAARLAHCPQCGPGYRYGGEGCRHAPLSNVWQHGPDPSPEWIERCIREVKADAWDEGHRTPWASLAMRPGMADRPAPNPYRAALATVYADQPERAEGMTDVCRWCHLPILNNGTAWVDVTGSRDCSDLDDGSGVSTGGWHHPVETTSAT